MGPLTPPDAPCIPCARTGSGLGGRSASSNIAPSKIPSPAGPGTCTLDVRTVSSSRPLGLDVHFPPRAKDVPARKNRELEKLPGHPRQERFVTLMGAHPKRASNRPSHPVLFHGLLLSRQWFDPEPFCRADAPWPVPPRVRPRSSPERPVREPPSRRKAPPITPPRRRRKRPPVKDPPRPRKPGKPPEPPVGDPPDRRKPRRLFLGCS